MAPKAARGVCKRPAGGMCKRPAKRSKTGGVSVISEFLECALTKLSKPQLDRLCQHLQDKFTVSSACTGSGMAEVVHAELTRMLKLPSEVAFSCEKVKSKREFYMSVVSPHLSVHGCMFDDMTSLPDLVAQCSAHGHACRVPTGTSLHVCGFSCKDLSKLNNNWSPAQKAVVLQKQLGSSGKTFAALTNFANKAKPKIMILENVDELEDKGEPNPNLDFLYEVTSAVGYSMGQKTLVSTNFGIPQGRKRVYFVCIHNESFGLNPSRGQALVERILQQVDVMQCPTKSRYHFLLPPGHPHLVQELAEVESKMENEAAPGSSASAGWLAEHEALFKSKGIAWKDMQPSRLLANSPWYRKLTRRKRESLNYHTFRVHQVDDIVKGPTTTLDLSQSIARASAGYKGICQTLTPKMCTWMFAHDADADAEGDDEVAPAKLPEPGRPMLGIEAMMIQGFPGDWLLSAPGGCPPNTQLLDLAGNAFSSTVFAAVYLSVLAELPKPVKRPSSSDLEAIFQALL